MIKLSYGGEFDENELVDYIRKSANETESSEKYIIKGSNKCGRDAHPKPLSLDYWLRQFAPEPNMLQSTDEVSNALVNTTLFEAREGLACPDSGRDCKGLVLVQLGYIDSMIRNCHLAKSAKPVREFVLTDLCELDDISSAIYIIEEVNSNNTEQTFQDFSDFRDRTERACARLNAPSNIMYVGSSTTGVKNRIKEHRGDGYPGKSALHLRHWFNGEHKITVKEYDEPREIIQIIEDDLHDKLKPAFGKMGGNNR